MILGRKKEKKPVITPEKVASAFEKLNKQAAEIAFDFDEIRKFVMEAIQMFISNTRFLTDQIAILAERFAELETLAQKRTEEKE